MANDTKLARAAKARRESKARRASSGVLPRILIMLAIVAAVILGVAIFFKVNTVEVQGNTIYAADRIVQASAIQNGDNLLTLNKAEAVGNIKAALPYVEEVSIGRVMPDTVVILVKESEASFAVRTDDGSVWLMNTKGKALERIEASEFEDRPRIEGLTVTAPVMGQPMTTQEQAKLDAALTVLSSLDGSGLLEHIVSVNVEKDYDIAVWYEDRYEILLGGSQEMDYKMQYLRAILDQLSEYQAGTIDLTLSKDAKASFRPKT